MVLNDKDPSPKKRPDYLPILMIAGGSLVILVAIIYGITSNLHPRAGTAPADVLVEQAQAGQSLEQPTPTDIDGNRTYLIRPIEVNFAAPSLTLKDLQGKQVALDDYLGKVVLVNNWATWCPPCQAEMPALNEYFQKHQDQDFTLIAIEAGEPAQEVQEFVDTFQLMFPVWLDPNAEAISAFRNNDLPSSYVIDRQGTVRLAWIGGAEIDMLEDYITPMLEH